MAVIKWSNLIFAVIISAGLTVPSAIAASDQIIIKVATIAPEGSAWDRKFREMNQDLQEKTENRVRYQIYPSGVAGDEKAVLSKIRIGQLDGGAFTGYGMGEILPEVRIFDLPFFLTDSDQFHRVRAGLTPHFEKAFREKGYVLVGWVDLGSVYFYSAKPINTLDALEKTKVWVWDGDTLARYCWRKLGITPVPLSIVDVMMGLQAGLVDTVYNTPLGAISFQWFVQTRYHTTTPIGFFTAALLVKEKQFEKLSPEDQELMLDLARDHFDELNGLVEKQNIEALEVMEKRGVAAVKWSAADDDALKVSAARVCRELIGKQYPESLLREANRLKNAEPAVTP